MNKEEFIQFVAKNLKYHLPSDFNSYQIEVNHMRLTISESNSSKQLNVSHNGKCSKEYCREMVAYE